MTEPLPRASVPYSGSVRRQGLIDVDGKHEPGAAASVAAGAERQERPLRVATASVRLTEEMILPEDSLEAQA